jgi:hypothetical protein
MEEEYKPGDKFELTYIGFKEAKANGKKYEVELKGFLNEHVKNSDCFRLLLKVENGNDTIYSPKDWLEQLEFKEGMLLVKRKR